MSILIKNGRIITSEKDYFADIFIENEKISAIEKNINNEFIKKNFNQVDINQIKVIDAKEKYIFPGGIDPHVHLEMNAGQYTSADDFQSGTIAAAFGGTTTIIDFANQQKGNSAIIAFDDLLEKAKKKSFIDFKLHVSITDNIAVENNEIAALSKRGVNSFKFFTAYPNRMLVDDATLYKTFQEIKKVNGIALLHAENGVVIDEIVNDFAMQNKLDPIYHFESRPASLEAEAIYRVATIAQLADIPLYIVHLSSSEGLEVIQYLKQIYTKKNFDSKLNNHPPKEKRHHQYKLYAETCVQYLLLDKDLYLEKDACKYIATPPLREKENQDSLWDGLQLRDIQVVATDHCPFMFESEKLPNKNDFRKIPNGIGSIENRMSLLYTYGVLQNKISLNQFVDITSTQAAKIFDLYPQKGSLEINTDADIIIFDPNKKTTIQANNLLTHHSKCDYSIYENFKIQGMTETVLLRGNILIENYILQNQNPHGKYLG